MVILMIVARVILANTKISVSLQMRKEIVFILQDKIGRVAKWLEALYSNCMFPSKDPFGCLMRLWDQTFF